MRLLRGFEEWFTSDILVIVTEMIKIILLASLPIVGIVALIGTLVGFLVVGPVFSMEVFKPNFKKFNPVENIKQLAEMGLMGMMVPEEWGGANEVHLLKNGWVGVLGHIACYDEQKNKHYYSMAFGLNPDTMERSPLKIIAVRGDFPDGPEKRPDLEDVIFSGGLIRKEHGRAELSVGVSDAEAYRIEIPDPFLEYEAR